MSLIHDRTLPLSAFRTRARIVQAAAASSPKRMPARAQMPRVRRAGQVIINGGAWNCVAPFGGYKQESGSWGLEEFLEVKELRL
jgi:acyl-CoA reductase-like NAD-dependent aldehyde dehydrogenase